jgi:hypothetical protein
MRTFKRIIRIVGKVTWWLMAACLGTAATLLMFPAQGAPNILSWLPDKVGGHAMTASLWCVACLITLALFVLLVCPRHTTTATRSNTH